MTWEKEPEVETWKTQGRTDEQVYGAINFLTGQGGIMINRLLLEARAKAIKDYVESGEAKEDVEMLINEALQAQREALIEEVGKMSLSFHDLDMPIEDCIAGKTSKLEDVCATVWEIVEPKVKKAIISFLRTYKEKK